MKKVFIENLKSCFPDQNQVHISDIAMWVGKKTAIKARRYANAEGFVKIN